MTEKRVFNPNATTSMYSISRETRKSLYPDFKFTEKEEHEMIQNPYHDVVDPIMVENTHHIDNKASHIDVNPLTRAKTTQYKHL